MRSTPVSTLLAAASLAAVVVLYLKVDRLERDLGTARTATRDARVPVESSGDPLRDAFPRMGAGDAPGGADAPRPGAGTSMASGVAQPVRELSVEDRLAQLEARQQKLEGGSGLPWHAGGKVPVRSMDDLAQRLALTETQRSRIEDAVARGRQRIEDVLKIPDETGKSPYERRAETRKKLEEAMKSPGTGLFALATDMTSYRQKKIPGRGDTYGDEINRIRKETREEIAAALDGKQQETFRDTGVDGLLGEVNQVSVAYALGDPAGEGEGAGLVIEMESDLEAEEGATPPPGAGGAGR
ncbi:MAG: hypothetical protein L6Q95_10160 [Planctomycetes bacterium]|nr:hypothetical protein [Planctomycetota bacterium]